MQIECRACRDLFDAVPPSSQHRRLGFWFAICPTCGIVAIYEDADTSNISRTETVTPQATAERLPPSVLDPLRVTSWPIAPSGQPLPADDVERIYACRATGWQIPSWFSAAQALTLRRMVAQDDDTIRRRMLSAVWDATLGVGLLAFALTSAYAFVSSVPFSGVTYLVVVSLLGLGMAHSISKKGGLGSAYTRGPDRNPKLRTTRGPVGESLRKCTIVGSIIGRLCGATILGVILLVAVVAALFGKGPFQNATILGAFLKLLLPSPPFPLHFQNELVALGAALVVIALLIGGASVCGALGGRKGWRCTPQQLLEYYRGYADGWH